MYMYVEHIWLPWCPGCAQGGHHHPGSVEGEEGQGGGTPPQSSSSDRWLQWFRQHGGATVLGGCGQRGGTELPRLQVSRYFFPSFSSLPHFLPPSQSYFLIITLHPLTFPLHPSPSHPTPSPSHHLLTFTLHPLTITLHPLTFTLHPSIPFILL